MTRATFNKVVFKSFVLGEEQIRSLAKVLQDYAGEPAISVECADDATRSFENTEELFEYQNAKRRRITSLSLRSYTGMHTLEEAEASIDFTCGASQTRWDSYTFVRVGGEERRTSVTNRELHEVIEGSQPWYSWISKTNTLSLWWPVFFVTLYVLYIQFGLVSSPVSAPVTISAITLWRVFQVAVLSGCSALATAYVVRVLFPVSVFLIGQEKKRHKTKDRVRWIVIGTVATTILTGLLSLALR